MENVLKDIQAQMATVAALKYTDQDWGQLDYYSSFPPAQWPAGIVSLVDVKWENLKGLKQKGLATFRIRVADQRLTPSSSKASATQKSAAMAIVRIVDDVTRALHGWTGQTLTNPPTAGDVIYNRLARTNTRRIVREDGLQVYEILFTTDVTEDLNPVLQTVTGATPQIQASLMQSP